MTQQVLKNTIVSIDYEMLDADGGVIEKTDPPISYLHGGYDGIFPKVEEGLTGKSTGSELAISLEPLDAFGEYDESLIRMEPLSVFPPNLEIGMQFEGVPPGEDDDRWIIYTVTDIAEGQAVVDGNHPLAGERLLFKCTVAEVRSASAEEISHGHPHGAHGVHH